MEVWVVELEDEVEEKGEEIVVVVSNMETGFGILRYIVSISVDGIS